MIIEVSKALKSFLYDNYEIEIGEIASKQIIDYIYPMIENEIHEDMKMEIQNETINDVIAKLESEKIINQK
ncbi:MULTISPECIES: hypothetical protein [Staphylococcus]|mgnify:FL=1|jgi:hypothetical protein|uniref:hypothetical protein n=1 Tax=Staphylococcus TaxID=1279 RepID=UPI0001A5CD1D|nr:MULTISPECIES: hypothetical protein [Staphylococcus]EEQ79113.1 hypothetical protein STAWA0001_0124 [Staphylococcus warneri L37603]MBO0376752.1 hypothetical protein [Staphylococcus warneri]MCI2748307.1 hypothetical protein [Staphylococcus warneri]MCI2776698.1 hypothetical protein [Staphylococcus warneri]MCI2789509.1 hypothetical protein [Staphylococcus warneri]